MEGDGGNQPPASAGGKISTHALTWRATVGMAKLGRQGMDFYPRPHMEGDAATIKRDRRQTYFYPRPHMEGDSYINIHAVDRIIFLPTPSHGGRHGPDDGLSARGNFYPRPHMEGDMVFDWFTWYRDGFLPTPSHGGRPDWVVQRLRVEQNFYPRPHMEGDLLACTPAGR